MRGRRPFTDQEVQTLLNSFKESEARFAKRDRAWFAYGISCGFRISELLSMRIKDVAHYFQATGYATVERRNTKGKKAGRTEKVESWAVQIMQDWLDELHGQGIPKYWYVFQSQVGENNAIGMKQASRILLQECSKNKIYANVGTHSMRKTYANKMRIYYLLKYQEGELIDPKQMLMSATGHQSEESLDAYLSFLHIEKEDEVFNYKP